MSEHRDCHACWYRLRRYIEGAGDCIYELGSQACRDACPDRPDPRDATIADLRSQLAALTAERDEATAARDAAVAQRDEVQRHLDETTAALMYEYTGSDGGLPEFLADIIRRARDRDAAVADRERLAISLARVRGALGLGTGDHGDGGPDHYETRDGHRFDSLAEAAAHVREVGEEAVARVEALQSLVEAAREYVPLQAAEDAAWEANDGEAYALALTRRDMFLGRLGGRDGLLMRVARALTAAAGISTRAAPQKCGTAARRCR